MKNAKNILENIVKAMPGNMRENALQILETRFLANNTATETAEILGIPYPVVVKTLKTVRDITRGKNPLDFMA